MDKHKEFSKALKEFLSKIKVPDEYFVRIINEDDDWTAIIKFHFLIEGALKKTFSSIMDDKRLEEEFYKLESEWILNSLVKAKVLDEETKIFIKYIQNKRNKLVHDISNNKFSFEQDFKNKDLKNNFVKMTTPYINPNLTINNEQVNIKNFILENPKVAIFYGVINLFTALEFGIKVENLSKKKKFLDTFFKDFKDSFSN